MGRARAEYSLQNWVRFRPVRHRLPDPSKSLKNWEVIGAEMSLLADENYDGFRKPVNATSPMPKTDVPRA